MRMGELERAIGVRQRVAVVGSGVAGMASAWLLAERHAVTLFEAERQLGGHTHTVEIELEGQRHPVDTGFLVFNRRTYPHLCALFAHLGVEAVESEMSFAVSLGERDVEWSGTNLATLFAQKRNLLQPQFLGMVRDLLRFNREATALARAGRVPALSLGEYLLAGGYGAAFRDWYLLPMAAAIWSCPTGAMLQYPLETFLRFCHNHGLLQIFDRPRWLTVAGGGRRYVEKMAGQIPDVRRATPVRAVDRQADGVGITTDGGHERFDQVVFAGHSDQTLALLGAGASAAEQAVLGAIRYQPNIAYLHTDAGLLPRRRAVWSAWNYLGGAGDGADRPVAVSYLINRLQPLPFTQPVVVTLNPHQPPAEETVLGRYEYAHPVFDQAAIDAQARLPELQGQQRSWFAGAWTGYGFHEDGLRSALAVAAALGVTAPWQVSDRATAVEAAA